MHSVAIYTIPAPLNLPFRQRSLGFLQFFMLQAAAITAEDAVQYVYARAFGPGNHPRLWQRWLGYVWVVCWFGFSLPYFLDIMLQMKSLEKPMLPFTVVGSVVPYLAMCSGS